MKKNNGIQKLTLAGLIITLGIVYGDIGTSPLYVMKAILSLSEEKISRELIFGTLSCIFWTLTLQTTVKYVIIAIRNNNHGEGGIFALFALFRKKWLWVAVITMIGGCMELADGVITPAITVTSSIEGLRMINPSIPVIPIVLSILTILFFIQKFGTSFVGKTFGPVMLIWFSMLAVLGLNQIFAFPEIINAVNPKYAYHLLAEYPGGIVLLGAVFLCTTGAEALYSDLGHCGLRNIRVSWMFVKTTLVLNYLGQGAWILMNQDMAVATHINPFYAVMPQWFLLPGIVIATMAAIIASQALISGAFTLVSLAVSLNFWPKIKINYPTVIKGQVFIPFVNTFLWIACCFVVIFFRESENMNAAYGLSITITMIMTTLLLTAYFFQSKVNSFFTGTLLLVYLTIEGTFLVANLHKFTSGGWFTMLLGLCLFMIMYGWYFGRKLKNSYITFINFNEYLPVIKKLSKDKTIPKYASNIVYLIKANRLDHVESKIIYSILRKPKRADRYWFLHVNIMNNPNTFEYEINQIIPDILIKVDFHLGFKVEPKINFYFRQVLEDMEHKGELSLTSKYSSLKEHNIPSDFTFINLDRIMTKDHTLPFWKSFTMTLHSLTRAISINDVVALGLDTSNVVEEKIPIIIEETVKHRIQRRKKSTKMIS